MRGWRQEWDGHQEGAIFCQIMKMNKKKVFFFTVKKFNDERGLKQRFY